jgi:acyl dehydratase
MGQRAGEECTVERAEHQTLIADLSQVHVGQRWRSDARTLSEHELSLACMLSNDWHPIHADAHYAAASAMGQRVFQGGYGVLLALGMATRFPAVGTRHALALGMQGLSQACRQPGLLGGLGLGAGAGWGGRGGGKARAVGAG